MTSSAILNAVLYLPLVAAIIIAVLPRDQHGWIRNTALGATAVTMLLSWLLWPEFNFGNNAEPQFLTDLAWIPQFHVRYKIGADGISFALILLTTLITTIAVAASWDAIQDRVREYFVFLLLLETGMLGAFVALDLILFYVFWELMLIPMYFLIGIWGGPRRSYATIKFILYTLVGSLLMLVAMVWIYVAAARAGNPTFDITVLADPAGPLASSGMDANIRTWLFFAFAAAFAIKVPMWPFHTWLPDAHVEAPTACSVILAAVLLKMGTYGFIRFCIPLFPEVALQWAPLFLALAVVGIIYGALMAYVQQDVKRLVAYSSVSHLGFCMLGLFAFTRQGVAGSVLTMINHGLSTGALFLLVGMIYERRHTREISEFGGLWKVMPRFGLFFLITMLSSVGLPGLNGFVGEFLILIGTWGTPETRPLQMSQPWAAALGATGVILGAIYMLWMFQRVMQGPLDNPANKRLHDLNGREIALLLPLIALMFWIGIRPNSVLNMFDLAISRAVVVPVQDVRRAQLAGRVNPGAAAVPAAPVRQASRPAAAGTDR